MAKKTAIANKAKQPQVPDLHGNPRLMPLAHLLFDPANPRTVERLGPAAKQGQIEDFLLTGEMKARDLVPSFVTNGYIPYEPLIVSKSDKGRFVVVEGNRRLAALRSMQNSDDESEREAFKDHNLNEIPCLVFEGDERQLLAYLGLRHLSKTKDWTTAAKGAFVERVLKASKSEDPAERLQEAGRLTNTTTSALRLTLLTRRLFEEATNLGLALSETGADHETTFWHLGDAVRRSNTKAYLKLEENPDPLLPPSYDENRFEKLVTWLYGNPKTKQSPLIASIRDIPDLNRCLGDARSTRAIEAGDCSLKEAMEELEAAGANVASHLERAKKSVQRAGLGLSDVDKDGLATVVQAQENLRTALSQFDGNVDVLKKRLQGGKS